MDLYIKELDLDLIQPNKSNYMNPAQGSSKIVVIGKPGCFRKNTEILMFDGSIKHVQDVKIGDVIMGNDGTKRHVLELFHNIDSMYKIIPVRGEAYSVNKQHDLVLWRNGDIEIISVENYLKKSDWCKKRFKIFRSSGIDWDEKHVQIDPYRFGLFLAHQSSDGPLESVPFEYKITCRKNRLELLAGMIDGAGLKKKNGYEIALQNESLLDDFIFIARSLGLAAYKKSDNRCIIYGDIPVKKVKKTLTKPIKNHLLQNFTVEYENIDEYFGFRLDGNNLFLLKSFDVVKNTGKTTIITSLLYEKRDIFPMFMIMSGTEDSNGHYKSIIPSTFVYNKLDEKKIEDFIVRQKIAKKHLENPWGVLLLDDCTDDPRIFNRPLMQGIFKNGRHWKMLFILSLQYCMDVKPVIRTNVDGVFILRETNLRNRKNLWENYAGVVPDFNLFCQIMDSITTDYTALYIHNQTTSNKLEDCLFWYKAKPVPEKIKLGSVDLWKFHKTRFNPDFKEGFF
jgi:hypothetical protein